MPVSSKRINTYSIFGPPFFRRELQEAWGVSQGEFFLKAASEAGLQGAQPIAGGLGVSPRHFFLQLPVSPQAKQVIEAE